MDKGSRKPLRGSIVALVTPMDKTGAVDYAALKRLIDWQIEQGTDCISVTGTTGEACTITVAEHMEIIRFSVECVAGRVPLLAGCGANSTHEAIALAKAAQKFGADYQLQVVPYYNKPTQRGIYEHFLAIAEETGDVPVVMYNVPGRTAVGMTDETILELADVPGICGIKEAGGDVVKVQSLINNAPSNFAVYSGDDLTAVFSMLAGGLGNISVTANVAPKLMHELCQAAIAQQAAQAIGLQQQLFELHKALFVQSNPIPVKWALHKLGFGANYLRLPLTPLPQQDSEVVTAALRKAGVI